MKTFKQFCEQANNIRSLAPFKVMPPLKKKDGTPNPAPKRTLIDPITGFGPGQFKSSTKTNSGSVS